VKLLQAITLFNGEKTGVRNSTNVTAVIQDPNDQPPAFQRPTSTAVVKEGITAGSLVPGFNMIVTDPDSVSIRPVYCCVISFFFFSFIWYASVTVSSVV